MKIYTKKLVVALLLLAILAPGTTLAKKVRREALAGVARAHAEDLPGAPVSCDFTMPETAEFKAQFVAVRAKSYVSEGEAFEVKIYLKNVGNVPWFSSDSGCNVVNIVSLGTDKERDRSSIFYSSELKSVSNWLAPNRIKMDSDRVDPQEIATFVFVNKAPETAGYYREYFAPLIEGVTWMDGGLTYIDTKVGDVEMDPEERELLSYIQVSTDLSKIDLTGDKKIEVDLSEQKMWLKIGDYVVREFRVSTGKARTPTPVGVTTILEKKEVRVASKSPHYIMPKWMMYRRGGYGIHALPSLGNDRGVYWREALSHIGIPVSHGCIRLLPKDAEFAYEFGEVGTVVEVHR